MTGTDLLLQLRVQINKLDTDSNKVLYPEVGLLFLNDAYLSLVKAKYSMENTSGTGMGKGQKSEDELMHLIATSDISGQTNADGEISVSSVSMDRYLYYLDTDKLVCGGSKVLEVREKPAGRSSTSRQDPFNRPTKLYPTLQQINNTLVYSFAEVSKDVTGTIIYLQLPEEITLTGETKCPFCDEIINTAATEILENWEDQRFANKAQLDQAIKNN